MYSLSQESRHIINKNLLTRWKPACAFTTHHDIHNAIFLLFPARSISPNREQEIKQEIDTFLVVNGFADRTNETNYTLTLKGERLVYTGSIEAFEAQENTRLSEEAKKYVPTTTNISYNINQSGMGNTINAPHDNHSGATINNELPKETKKSFWSKIANIAKSIIKMGE